ncbi:MAG: BatD family protein [Mediterranea sp.]|jgi:hypothetical protein|nr:BatD family protein [Mediterranea sp.]
MRRTVLLYALLTLFCLRAAADDKVTFTASAPDAVAVGDQFRLTYTVTTQKVRDFSAPTMKGFDVLMGPTSSRQSSTSIINGKTSSSSSTTFTYILMATTEGTYSIPGATITADGTQLLSNAVEIKVLPADSQSSAGSGTADGNNRRSSASSSGNTIGANDLFVLSTVNKTNVYEQEALLLTYKIYTAVDLRGLDNAKLPDFKGFHSQEVELPANRKWSLEHYKGRNYQTTIYRQFVLFPQQSGTITIEPARFDASVAKSVQVSDPFEAFFNGGSNYVEVKKTLMTPQINIDVKPLPAGKPAGFSGAVGDFNITSSINSTEVKTNDAVTVKLVISGTGNLKLLGNPEIKFPEEFEIYDPKADNKFRLTEAGLSGSKVIEYLAIPRTAGNFKIPAVSFSYFDLKSRSYKTLSTEAYQLQVEKGAGNATQTIANFTGKEELKILGEDIRFIKQNPVKLSPRGYFFYGSWSYWLWYLVPLLIFVLFFALYRKQIAANANVAAMRTKKANKIAVKRMKQAERLLKENKQDAFYDEVLKALWGYISDKLNIPVSRLSKDNIEEELRRYGVADELIEGFLAALKNCEFARFAPGNAEQAMDKVYTDSLAIISRMEAIIKH